jgi:predicted Zn-dependent protease
VVGREKALDLLDQALKACPRDGQAEALLTGQDHSLTRYANSTIHQNVSETNATLSVRMYLGKKMGRAVTNVLTRESVKKAAETAAALARLAPENPEFVSLPGPRPVPAVASYVEATARADAGQRADNVLKVIAKAAAGGYQAAGAHSTGTSEIAVANSLGVRAYGALTGADLTCVIMSQDGSGYADAVSRDLTRIDAGSVAEEAVQRCATNKDQVALEPGEYTVVLEPYAVDLMISDLSRMGLSARSYQDGQSFLCGNMGKPLMSPSVTIWDDGLDPAGAAFAFDLEGQPKSKVVFIREGVGEGLAYDSFSAFKEGGKESTGHSSGCRNLFMAPGDLSREELIGGVERGVLVTRFHYVRAVHSQRTIITGMTRDGTYLIEGGKVTKAALNMRFTQSIMAALAGVEGLSRDRRTEWSSVVPTVRLARFDFTGRAGH